MGLIHSQETKVLNVTQYGKKKRKKITVMGQIPWFLRENRKEKGHWKLLILHNLIILLKGH